MATAVTLDHNWRWLHAVGDYVNCYEGNEWDDKFCPDVATCTENCALGGGMMMMIMMMIRMMTMIMVMMIMYQKCCIFLT